MSALRRVEEVPATVSLPLVRVGRIDSVRPDDRPGGKGVQVSIADSYYGLFGVRAMVSADPAGDQMRPAVLSVSEQNNQRVRLVGAVAAVAVQDWLWLEELAL